MRSPRQRGWHSRGYLPHLDFRSATQAVTFRLADSLPATVVERWKRELGRVRDSRELLRRIASHEDAGHGSCLLGAPANAQVLEEALSHFEGDRYDLLEWAVMPNHVHVLFRPHSATVDRIVHSWKRYSARKINERMGRRGPLWERDYFDRVIRDEAHFHRAVRYIRENPVKAGLCSAPEDWRFGSAGKERRFGNRHPPDR